MRQETYNKIEALATAVVKKHGKGPFTRKQIREVYQSNMSKFGSHTYIVKHPDETFRAKGIARGIFDLSPALVKKVFAADIVKESPAKNTPAKAKAKATKTKAKGKTKKSSAKVAAAA